jgi:uncharacterized protein (TIGR00369 family)
MDPIAWRDDGHCFACGPKNPIGLHLRFEATRHGCRTRFTAGREHQGYEGVVHGGIVATLLDEVVIQMLWASGVPAVTAKLDVRFLKPVPVGEELEAQAVFLEKRGRVLKAEATLRSMEGTTLATAQATCLMVAATSERKQGAEGQKDRGAGGRRLKRRNG